MILFFRASIPRFISYAAEHINCQRLLASMLSIFVFIRFQGRILPAVSRTIFVGDIREEPIIQSLKHSILYLSKCLGAQVPKCLISQVPKNQSTQMPKCSTAVFLISHNWLDLFFSIQTNALIANICIHKIVDVPGYIILAQSSRLKAQGS